ncbi:MAG: hypothetical protein R2795_05210 [Saprospiraceae bacterium]
MEGISFAYPAWYIIFCLMLGVAYALVLYFRNKVAQESPAWLSYLLAGFRFIVVSWLALLLLSPIIRSVTTKTEKPIIVIAQDGSESIQAAMTDEDSSAYANALRQLQAELGEKYEVATFTFGDVVRDTLDGAFRDKRTNLSAMLQEVYDLYSNQNLGALILATDGIYNEGANPVYTDAKINAPVYSIALGDTTRYKDIAVKRVFHNKVAYLGDRFSLQVDISGQNAAGNTIPLRIARIENGKTRELFNESINVDRNDFFATKEYVLDADLPGVNRYRISLGTLPGEATTANNSRDIFVDVLEARQQVLILANAPHPDLSALKQSISKGRNNEVVIEYISTFAGDVKEADLVILHELPSINQPADAILKQLTDRKIPVWFIAGQQTGLTALNKAQQLLGFPPNGRNVNEVQARMSAGFNVFNISDEVRNLLPKLPPLEAPFGEFKAGSNAAVMHYQRIGRIDTEYPLLALGEEDGRRMVVLAGTGLWKWRLFDYLDSNRHDRFDEWVSQITQYLSVKDDKRRFRVTLAKNIFDENEPLIFNAELYNDNYELINDPAAQLTIIDEAGREYNYTFNPSGRSYSLNAGILPVGNYRYKATVNTGLERLEHSGQFSIQPVQLELFELTADHNLLRLLGERYGGGVVYPSQIGSLPQLLEDKGTVKPVLYDSVQTRSLINIKWIFFLLLSLLTAEWFLRRYFGSY